jgi:hypothetical protein
LLSIDDNTAVTGQMSPNNSKTTISTGMSAIAVI